jgi:hypothetical protein
MRLVAARHPYFWLAVVFLGLSTLTYELVPVLVPHGADLQGLWAFHHCIYKNQPFGVLGGTCHDRWNRAIVYSPVFYWSYVWTRAFDHFEDAVLLWRWVIPALVLPTFFAFAPAAARREAGHIEAGVFWLLLMVQFPMQFALERCNSDAVVVALWALATWLTIHRRSLVLAGACAGLAAASKVYPAVALAVIAIGLLGRSEPTTFGWRAPLRFGAGAAAAVVATIVPLWHPFVVWSTEVLPAYSMEHTKVTIYSHSVPELADSLGHPGWAPFTSAVLVASWAVTSCRQMRPRPHLCFAGALAVSTYCARTSLDYNLVTVYPLLLVLFVDAARGGLRSTQAGWGLLGLGLLSVTGDRHLFLAAPYEKVHIVLQVLWLLLVAGYYGLYEPFGTSTRTFSGFSGRRLPLRLVRAPRDEALEVARSGQRAAPP